MKYASAKLRQMLAAEYVLGTLHGRARARFQGLLGQDASLQKEVFYWEQRLAGLNGRIKPVAPPALVWTQLDRLINANKVTSLPQRAARGGVNLWRAWSAVSTAAAVTLGIGLWQQLQTGPQIIEVPKIVSRIVEVPKIVEVEKVVTVQAPAQPLPYVAILQPAKSEARWKVSMYPDRGLMKVAATGSYDMNVDKNSLELWLIEAQGPRSLGLLPNKGVKEMPLPKALQMQGDLTLAISVEPRGGSPSGKPTGPVILAAPAIRAL